MDASVTTYINDITRSMGNVSAISNIDTTIITNSTTEVDTIINSYLSAATNDIAYDVTSLDWFKSVANGSRFSVDCSTNSNYTADSLVPSTQSPSVNSTVPCANGLAPVTCTNFATCPTGCIDLTALMAAYANVANLQTDLATRYGSACAAAIGPELATLYQNWQVPRATGIGAVQTRWTGGAKSDLTNLAMNLQGIKPNLQSITTSLNMSLLDPTYGALAGLNCLPIGETLVTVKDTICTGIFNNSYMLTVALGIICFAMLFGLCFLTCSIRRQPQSWDAAKLNYLGTENTIADINKTSKF